MKPVNNNVNSDINIDDIPIHIKKNLIQVVIRQTDYDVETAERNLIKFNYNVSDVIRNYMIPNYDNNKVEDTIVTNVHQQKFTEIRNMMDDASSRYRKQQQQEEYNNIMRKQYADNLKNQEKK
tara:strand:- start:11376 stop:11744 length:369 start_codon:yes stop_codon:yes gene_type:complete